MKNRPITKKQIEAIANAPVHLIEDSSGMVIGNSQALAKMCLLLENILLQFGIDMIKAIERMDELIKEEEE